MAKRKEARPSAADARVLALRQKLLQRSDLAKWGLTDFYDDVLPVVREIWETGADVDLSWGCKKEIRYATVSRVRGRTTVRVSAHMDDGVDLIDTLIWDADGKRAGSGFSVLDALGVTAEDVINQWLDSLSELDLIHGINESGVSDVMLGGTFDQLCEMIEELEEDAEEENDRRYRDATEWVKRELAALPGYTATETEEA